MTAMPNSMNKMERDVSSDFLLRLPIFQGMPRNEVIRFISSVHGNYTSFDKGEFIGMEGEMISGIGVLLTGMASVFKENAAGERHRMATLKPGDIFGEVAVYTGEHWTASVMAEEPSAVLILPRQQLLHLNETAGAAVFQMNMLKLVSKKALKLNQKLEILSMRSLRRKLIRLFQIEWKSQKQNPLILPMNREELAEYLQVSRPALSRELMNMKRDNLIDFSRNKFYVSDQLAELE